MLAVGGALACLVLVLAACSSGGGGGDAGPPPTVLIAPSQAVEKGASLQLSATVVDAAPGVKWAVEGGNAYGTITPDGGMYTAPLAIPDSSVVVRATSTADPRGTATSTIRVIVGSQLVPGDNVLVPNGGGVGSTFSAGQRSIAASGPLLYLVWSENQAGVDRVYLNVTRDRGKTIDPVPLPISPPATGPHRYPVAAVDGFGRAVVAWVGSEDGTVWKVHARSVSVGAAGLLVLGDVRDIATMGAVNDPRVALDVDRQGNAYLAWTAQGTSDTDVFVVRWESATGGTLRLSGVVPASASAASDQIRPAIAVNDSGGLVIAWSDPRDDLLGGSNDVWWRRAQFAGGTIEFGLPEARVNSVVNGPQAHASVALSGTGLAGIVWSDARTDQRRHVYFVQSLETNLGDPSEDREVLVVDSQGLGADADQNFPSLAFDVDGGITVAFADNRKCIEGSNPQACAINDDGPATGQTDIYVVRSVDNGQSFRPIPNPKVNDDTDPQIPQIHQHGGPSVAVDEVGRAFLLWTDDRATNGISSPYMARVE